MCGVDRHASGVECIQAPHVPASKLQAELPGLLQNLILLAKLQAGTLSSHNSEKMSQLIRSNKRI